jgi:hypothetical protein
MPIGLTSCDAYRNRSIPYQKRQSADFLGSVLSNLSYPTSAGSISTPPEGAESRLCRLTAPEHRGALPHTPVSLATRREQGLKAHPCPLLGAYAVPVSVKAKPPTAVATRALTLPSTRISAAQQRGNAVHAGDRVGSGRFSFSLGQARQGASGSSVGNCRTA